MIRRLPLSQRIEEDWGIEMIAPTEKGVGKRRMDVHCGATGADGKLSGSLHGCTTSAESS